MLILNKANDILPVKVFKVDIGINDIFFCKSTLYLSVINFQAIVGGKLNHVFTISVPDHPDDILAVRVFGEAGIAMMDHEVEYMIVKHLTKNTELAKIYRK